MPGTAKKERAFKASTCTEVKAKRVLGQRNVAWDVSVGLHRRTNGGARAGRLKLLQLVRADLGYWLTRPLHGGTLR